PVRSDHYVPPHTLPSFPTRRSSDLPRRRRRSADARSAGKPDVARVRAAAARPPPDVAHAHRLDRRLRRSGRGRAAAARTRATSRSEEHTSELQSLAYLVCRLLLEKK